jgi:hypothetical protein
MRRPSLKLGLFALDRCGNRYLSDPPCDMEDPAGSIGTTMASKGGSRKKIRELKNCPGDPQTPE